MISNLKRRSFGLARALREQKLDLARALQERKLDLDMTAYHIGMARDMDGLEPWPKWRCYADAALGILHGTFVSKVVCRIFGHKLKGVGYGNPDSGYMGVTCQRCGQHWGQRLY